MAPSSPISKRLEASPAPLLERRNFWRPPYPRKLFLYLFQKKPGGGRGGKFAAVVGISAIYRKACRKLHCAGSYWPTCADKCVAESLIRESHG